MRPFIFIGLFAIVGCRDRNYTEVKPAPPELVEISLDEYNERLSFLLPDAGWKEAEPDGFKGLEYESGARNLRIQIILKEPEFDSAVVKAQKQANGAEIRVFRPGHDWPFIGVIVTYRGPPDAPMLDAFVRSFKVERRYACAFSFSFFFRSACDPDPSRTHPNPLFGKEREPDK